MPYTNPWVDNIPLGSAPANTIDEQLRRLRLDIHERMNNIVVDWETDPVVPLASVGMVQSGVGYDDFESGGDKAQNYAAIVASLAINYRGNTTVGNVVVVNLNEINTLTGTTNWQVSNIFNPLDVTGANQPLSFTGSYDSGNEVLHLKRVVYDTVANTISFVLDGPSVLVPNGVRFMATFGFLVAP